MPGQRLPGQRAKGSRLLRLAGIGVVIVLAAGGATGYLFGVRPALRHSSADLSSRVISQQTVGLVAQDAEPGAAGRLVQLVGASGNPLFHSVSPAEVQSGSGQWTADEMADNTYIFIFVPDGQCLSGVGQAARPRLAMQHCDLQANQRWRRVGPAALTQGHDFYRYANLGNGACLTQTSESPGPVWGTSLAGCSAAPINQLIAFFWATA